MSFVPGDRIIYYDYNETKDISYAKGGFYGVDCTGFRYGIVVSVFETDYGTKYRIIEATEGNYCTEELPTNRYRLATEADNFPEPKCEFVRVQCARFGVVLPEPKKKEPIEVE